MSVQIQGNDTTFLVNSFSKSSKKVLIIKTMTKDFSHRIHSLYLTWRLYRRLYLQILLFNQAFQLLVRIQEDLGFSIKTLRIMVNSHVFFCLYMEADSAAILTNKQMKQQNKQTFLIHALFLKNSSSTVSVTEIFNPSSGFSHGEHCLESLFRYQ